MIAFSRQIYTSGGFTNSPTSPYVGKVGLEPTIACEVVLLALIEKGRSDRVEELLCARTGFEPATHCLIDSCSSQMSYFACRPCRVGRFLEADPGVEPGACGHSTDAPVKERVLVSVLPSVSR